MRDSIIMELWDEEIITCFSFLWLILWIEYSIECAWSRLRQYECRTSTIQQSTAIVWAQLSSAQVRESITLPYLKANFTFFQLRSNQYWITIIYASWNPSIWCWIDAVLNCIFCSPNASSVVEWIEFLSGLDNISTLSQSQPSTDA